MSQLLWALTGVGGVIIVGLAIVGAYTLISATWRRGQRPH
jgi:hypothetical protein